MVRFIDIRTYERIKVLLWKSYHSRRYYWKTTVIEAAVPILIALYVTWVIAQHPLEELSFHTATYKQVVDKAFLLQKAQTINVVGYTPDNDFSKGLLEKVKNEMGENKLELVAVKTEQDLESFVISEFNPMSVIGIIFHDIDTKSQKIPDRLVYELRQTGSRDTRDLFPVKETSGPYLGKDVYLDEGFAGFQFLINEQFIRMKSSDTKSEVNFQAFPYPDYESSPVPRESLSIVICFSIIITLIALSVPFINHVTEEKANGTKAYMMLYGVEEWIIWFCWFIHAFMVLAVSLTIMTIILKLPLSGKGSEPFRFAPFLILWLMFMLYCIANIAFSFLFCAIFHQGVIASFVYMIVSILEILINLGTQALDIHTFSLLLCIFPSSAFTKGFQVIRVFEVIGVTSPWSSMLYSIDQQNPTSLLLILLMLVIDIILYTFLTFYISSVNPGKYGSRKSPFFIFKSIIPSFQVNIGSMYYESEELREANEFIEPPPLDKEPALQIKDLFKEYGSLYAVNGVDLDMYEDEITILLGHNGAGKTTLLSMIAGLDIPDGGSITYKGIDVIENRDEFRENLGISFQEDRLFPYLSVMNHLLFYGMLKGFSQSEASEDAEYYLSKMDMFDERYSWIKHLNNSSRRKLSIIISLMGEPKMLILDQPTLGMDLPSKVNTWDLLMDIRYGRTIISTAHDLNEAEKIANRIAIMESGMIVSYGTVAFLKETFGAAYELSVTTDQGSHRSITALVNSHLDDVMVKQETNDEIVYKIMPTETPKFPEFFENLEKRRSQFGISSIEIGYTTLEQILLELGSIARYMNLSRPENLDLLNDSQYSSNAGGIGLVMLQLKTLFKKKILYTLRNYFYIFFRIIFPTLLVLLVVRIIELHDFSPGPHLDLSVASYPNSQVMLRKGNMPSKTYDLYLDYIQSKGSSVIHAQQENIIDELIEFGKQNIISFKKKLILALEFESSHKVLYNQWALHSLPIAITVYSNMILRSATNSATNEIVSIYHPIPDVLEESCTVESLDYQRFILSVLLFFVFAFLTVDLVFYFFEFTSMEISRSLMHVQIISSVPVWMYWFTTFIFDFLFFLIVVAARVALFKVLNDTFKFITYTQDFGLFLGIIVIFGVSGLLFVYFFSFYLHPTRETYIKFFIFNVLCSVSAFFYIKKNEQILHAMENYEFLVHGFELVMLLLPFFNFTLLVLRYIEIWSANTSCQLCAPILVKQCESTLESLPYFEYSSEENPNGLKLGIIFLIFDVFLYFILLYLINARFMEKIFNAFNSKDNDESDSAKRSEDVEEERYEIQQIIESESAYNEVPLLVNGLRKNYFKQFRSFLAVENVSFMEQHGMCFGILGMKESGKTTVIKMLAAEILPTRGDVSMDGASLMADKKQYISMIGYCPQINPLIDEFTGKEMLTLIASLRGISKSDVDIITDQWISFLRLEKHQDRHCGSYSDGSKRRLCTAISLIGNPKIVFLDEPTTDLDPLSTRILHDIIMEGKKSGLIVVLASQSMEECEILCDRLTILVQGVMICIGTLKHLKHKYSHGYSVTFKIHYDVASSDEVYALQEYMMNMFDPRYCELVEEQRGLLRYQIRDPNVSWSMLFGLLEEIKYNNPTVEEYIATNPTLEDIFITLSQTGLASSSYY